LEPLRHREAGLIMRHVGSLAAGLLVLSWQGHAADVAPMSCGDLPSGFEQKQCAELRYREASGRLREVCERVLRRAAGAQSAPGAPDGKGRAVAISESQRAWEAYRDTECRGVVGRGSAGSGRMVWVLGCLAEKTDARVQELNEPFDQR
jgi:uncharacterized protein YecT (DUF1311 family)